MTTAKLPFIAIYYHDVNEERPSPMSSDNFTIRRVVRDIQPIENPYPGQKAEQGVIQYKHKLVSVYRNTTHALVFDNVWYTTNKEKALSGVKGTKL